jgi:hypothetical protein
VVADASEHAALAQKRPLDVEESLPRVRVPAVFDVIAGMEEEIARRAGERADDGRVRARVGSAVTVGKEGERGALVGGRSGGEGAGLPRVSRRDKVRVAVVWAEAADGERVQAPRLDVLDVSLFPVAFQLDRRGSRALQLHLHEGAVGPDVLDPRSLRDERQTRDQGASHAPFFSREKKSARGP